MRDNATAEIATGDMGTIVLWIALLGQKDGHGPPNTSARITLAWHLVRIVTGFHARKRDYRGDWSVSTSCTSLPSFGRASLSGGVETRTHYMPLHGLRPRLKSGFYIERSHRSGFDYSWALLDCIKRSRDR